MDRYDIPFFRDKNKGGNSSEVDLSGYATKKYVDELIGDFVGTTSRITYINLMSENWQGSDNLYSQIVNIDGITEYSKVDINPSVEQLAVFYKKDVTFVTENEDGVVTVYCIGQKPLDDYTMQVTITEVTTNE